MLKGIKETILLLHSMALCERETVARAPPPAGWAASRCPNPPDRARYLTDALPAPYRYLTEPEHAFRPMFIRVLTDLTDLAPQGGTPRSIPPSQASHKVSLGVLHAPESHRVVRAMRQRVRPVRAAPCR